MLRVVVVSVFCALLAVLSIWWPVIHHQYYARSTAQGEWTQASNAQAALWAELADMQVGIEVPFWEKDLLATAEQIQAGNISLPEFGVNKLPLKSFAIDHQQGPATFQLAIASLKLEDVLLKAYQQSYRPQYLQTAAARFADFFAYHRHSYFSETFLRNDHAVAARVSVVLRLLVLIDTQQLKDAATLRQAALDFLADTVTLLREDRYYTARTNHGYAQNLALLQFATAFAAHPQAKTLREIALERIRQQLDYYVSPEGIILEHSAGYHQFGEKLLGYTEKLIQLNQLDSTEISKRYQAAQQFTRLLTRADGSLPSFGNTELDARVPLVGAAAKEAGLHNTASQLSVFPVAGYAVLQQPLPQFETQLHAVLAWSYFKNNGHKHADEMSLYLWAKDIEWTGGFGYWPYGYAGMAQAYGWTSSNAPHLAGEATNSQRSTSFDGAAQADNFAFVALTRQAKDASLNRQLISLNNQLLVLDFADSAKSEVATYWNFPAAVELTATAEPAQFNVTAKTDASQLQIRLWGQPIPDIRQLHGQMSPAAGWNVLRNVPTATDALAVQQAKGQTVTLTQLQFGAEALQAATLKPGSNAKSWQLTSDCIVLKRSAQQLSYQDQCQQRSLNFVLQPYTDQTAYQRIIAASEQAKQSYPYFKALVKYRGYATAAALVLLCGSLFLAFLLRGSALLRWLVPANLVGWPAFSAWALLIYLVA